MDFPYGVMVTVQRREEDAFGDFVTVSEHTIGPCAIDYTGDFAQPTASESTLVRSAILFAPPGSDIQFQDKITLPGPDGVHWLVVGDIADFVNPFTGWHPGMTIRLERATG